jgi:1-acyl-sn-glycerol-3-phosphate acyltransferase
MIGPQPNRLVQWWFDGWCRRAMARQFYRVHRWGDLPPPTTDATQDAGTLYVANHSSFWDGIVLWRLLHARHPGLLCAVDEVQMREHPFFARLGCFSIDRSRPRRAREALAYAGRRLREPGAALVLFPQGNITHADARPLRLERGVGQLVAVVRPRVVTVALRYDYWPEQRGEVLVDVADAVRIDGDRRGVTDRLARQLTGQLDALARRSRAYAPAPHVTRVGRASISHWKARWRRRPDADHGPGSVPRP